jgi:iron(III) transport system substrate-binding protein
MNTALELLRQLIACPDQGKNQLGCLVLPNAAVLIRNSPHPDAGRKLVDYLLSKETERKLAFADCAQIPLYSGVDTPSDVPKIDRLTTMPVDYAVVARKLQAIQPWLKQC